LDKFFYVLAAVSAVVGVALIYLGLSNIRGTPTGMLPFGASLVILTPVWVAVGRLFQLLENIARNTGEAAKHYRSIASR